MICKQCGQSVDATSGFCASCGAKIESENKPEQKKQNTLESPADIIKRNAHLKQEQPKVQTAPAMTKPLVPPAPPTTSATPTYTQPNPVPPTYTTPVYTAPVYTTPVYATPSVYVVPTPIVPARQCRWAAVIVSIVALMVALLLPMYGYLGSGIMGYLSGGEFDPFVDLDWNMIFRGIAIITSAFMVFLGLFRIRGAVITFASIGLGLMLLAFLLCVLDISPDLAFALEYTPIGIGVYLMIILDLTAILTS